MTISYNWLCEYLPVRPEPAELSAMLTSVGLEVEKMEHYEEVRGGLKGLVVGEVLEAVAHPNADKLRLTRVNIGKGEPLQIVCGAPNVAAGQKVVVATVGTTIYPSNGDPLTMKLAKIRGSESQGMICAEDEIGLGNGHAGIMVLPSDLVPGTEAASYFKPYSDIIYEIGLTPNRADAMSHLGVARDICALLSHQKGEKLVPVRPSFQFNQDDQALDIKVEVENTVACPRYSGVCISGISVAESPAWLQQKLRAIGQRPINNIVDITNFIQHETGQPMHAFDYDAINGRKVIVNNLPAGTLFKTLDEKERKLDAADLMICDAKGGMCIAGVFGGLESGVKNETKNIFLESAFFDPVTIRRTSFRHGLRTDAATRFEKGIDISATTEVLQRAAAMIREIAGGKISSPIIDIYPAPEKKKEVVLPSGYLKKLSGKDYPAEKVKGILQSLGFEQASGSSWLVPFHKRDVAIAADLVEEILRIDGLDNIPIPTAITITPAVDQMYRSETLKEKISGLLAGAGFSEILTNSITNSRYLSEEQQQSAVKMINNLSSELDVMRSSMLHTALEVIAFNQNRKQTELKLFEFGKTYHRAGEKGFRESEHLCIYITGAVRKKSWKNEEAVSDIFYLRGITEAVLEAAGVGSVSVDETEHAEWHPALEIKAKNKRVGILGKVRIQNAFDIRQPVFAADLDWQAIEEYSGSNRISYKEVLRFPSVERDLSMVVPRAVKYASLRESILKLRINTMQEMKLFDLFESEKIGAGKKSLAVNFVFQDPEKTLTDKEIDSWMNRIITTLENEQGAEIRK